MSRSLQHTRIIDACPYERGIIAIAFGNAGMDMTTIIYDSYTKANTLQDTMISVSKHRYIVVHIHEAALIHEISVQKQNLQLRECVSRQ
jgi:hypothetical protein